METKYYTMNIFADEISYEYCEFMVGESRVGVKFPDKTTFCECHHFLKESKCSHIKEVEKYIKSNPKLYELANDTALKRINDYIHINLTQEYFIEKFEITYENTFELFKFILNEIPEMIEREMQELVFKILDYVISEIETGDLSWQYHASDLLICEINKILDKLTERYRNEVLNFLDDIIDKSYSEFICEKFNETYLKYSD